MVFSSTLFLFGFLPITLLGYYILRGSCRNYWLLFVSILFFAWAQPNYLWVILLNVAINYVGARLISRWWKNKRLFLILTIFLNLGLLFYFKYFNFTIDSINRLLDLDFEVADIILPIGISFFTFQGMSYVIDVYRDDVPVQKNIFKMGLYIVLFPQLIAGPIVRYTDIASEIDKRKVSMEDFAAGIERFIIGLGKKAIIANTMAACADAIWANGVTHNTQIVAWVGSIAYTLQIYFDFSGYSDMAIGLGRVFGFHFNENFKLPYISQNITEFWRRWHISLSSWFRDYVYIPLGGNRKRVYLNLAIVFLLTGIWHGAAWNYVVWGVWNGCFILLERYYKSGQKDVTNRQGLIKIGISKAYTLIIVNFGWVLFRAPSIKEALKYGLIMLGLMTPTQVGYSALWYLDKWTLFVMVIGIIFASSVPTKMGKIVMEKIPKNVWLILKYAALLSVLYFSMLRVVSGTYNPFIYFQF